MTEYKMLNNISCSWIDPPPISAVEKIHQFNPPTAVLKQLREYHQLPKDKLDFIALRCASLLRLSFICSSANGLSQTDIDALRNISEMAVNKRRYLSELARLHKTEILLQDSQIYDKKKISPYFNAFANKKYCIVGIG